MEQKHYLILTVCIFSILYAGFAISPYNISYIVGTSMDPQIENYDIIIANENSKVDVNDVARVRIEERTHEYSIIHKVVEANETHVVTKGVNASTRDRPTVREDVQAEIVYSITPPDSVKNVYGTFLPDGYNELDEAVREGSIVCVLDSPVSEKHLGDGLLSIVCNSS
jgi:signal peptidase I